MLVTLMIGRFEAEKPYRFTHISNGFKLPAPLEAVGPHRGVVFPINLEKIGSDMFMLSYGEDSWRSKLMFFDRKLLESLLKPILRTEDVRRTVKHYSFCTLEGKSLL